MLSSFRSTFLNAEVNGGIQVATSVNGVDGLDKRNGQGGLQSFGSAINTVSEVSKMVTNAFGSRSPYYTIGEIPASTAFGSEWLNRNSNYLGSAGMAIRAISSIYDRAEQEGVIIDCLGDIDGTTSVDFTSNPMMYRATQIIDSRVRKPTTLNAVVAVSNYLSDDAVGTVLNTISALDPSGVIGGVTDMLLNGGNTRAQAALYKLRWLQENAKPFTVYTPHGIYENMLIKDIKPKTDAEKMDMLYCNITFQEVIMYTTYINEQGLRESTMPQRTGIAKTDNGTTLGGIYNKIRNWEF